MCNVLAAAVGLGAAAAFLCLLWIARQFIAGFFFALGALVVVAGVVIYLE
jgi:hypothetical protein